MKKNFFYFLIPLFIVGNIGFYFQERAKWIYPEQPYPEAKEWLIPANMMLVYGTTLTKLPFIDERSFIMRPILSLQDYFVSKWQENLPKDDIEKYLGWYIFRLRTYMVPNAGSVVLYTNDTYSQKETIEANEETWKVLEAIMQYKAKDKKFDEIRYAAFLTLTFQYLKNSTLYWAHKDASVKYYFDLEMMQKDRKKLDRYYKLFTAYIKINKEYKIKNIALYKTLNNPYYKYQLEYKLTDFIIRDLLYQSTINGWEDECCNARDKNKNFIVHFNAKKELEKLYFTEDSDGKGSIERLLNNSVDKQIIKHCKTRK